MDKTKKIFVILAILSISESVFATTNPLISGGSKAMAGNSDDNPPLTRTQIEEAIGVTPDTAIATLIGQRGIDFKVDQTVLSDLRRLRAGLKTIEALEAYTGPRLKVSLFDYGEDCRVAKDRFGGLLSDRLRSISDLFDPTGEGYLSKLKVLSEGTKNEMTSEEESAYWHRKHVLQILSGSCSGVDEVTSVVFLGTLNGSLERRVRIKFSVDDSQYLQTRDVHKLLILYSLANDAASRESDKEKAKSYLTEANSIAVGLSASDPSSVVGAIKSAVGTMLCELGLCDLQGMNPPKRDAPE